MEDILFDNILLLRGNSSIWNNKLYLAFFNIATQEHAKMQNSENGLKWSCHKNMITWKIKHFLFSKQFSNVNFENNDILFYPLFLRKSHLAGLMNTKLQ